jgi:hypothetical protein
MGVGIDSERSWGNFVEVDEVDGDALLVLNARIQGWPMRMRQNVIFGTAGGCAKVAAAMGLGHVKRSSKLCRSHGSKLPRKS